MSYADIAREIQEIAHVFRNGFCVFKSKHRYEDKGWIYLRNIILFSLFDTEIKMDHPSVTKALFSSFGSSQQIRTILHELCENKNGRWYFKNHQTYTKLDLYEQIEDKELIESLISDIKQEIADTDRYFDNL